MKLKKKKLKCKEIVNRDLTKSRRICNRGENAIGEILNRGNPNFFAKKFRGKIGQNVPPDAIGVTFCPAPNVIGVTFCPVFCNRGDVFRPDYARGRA